MEKKLNVKFILAIKAVSMSPLIYLSIYLFIIIIIIIIAGAIKRDSVSLLWFTLLIHIPVISRKKIDTAIGGKFYRKQRYSDEWVRKVFCVAITDSPLLNNVSIANAHYAPVQTMIVTDCIWKKLWETSLMDLPLSHVKICNIHVTGM